MHSLQDEEAPPVLKFDAKFHYHFGEQRVRYAELVSLLIATSILVSTSTWRLGLYTLLDSPEWHIAQRIGNGFRDC